MGGAGSRSGTAHVQYRKLPPAPGHPVSGVVFGKNFIILSTGTVAVGEEVTLGGVPG